MYFDIIILFSPPASQYKSSILLTGKFYLSFDEWGSQPRFLSVAHHNMQCL